MDGLRYHGSSARSDTGTPLGLFAAIGLILALGFVAHARTAPVRALAGASSVVLAGTLYFTFSRGAWLALALGLLSALATTPRRLQLLAAALVVAPCSAACIWLASREDALSTRGSAISDAADAGHRLALAIVALAVAAAVAALVFGVLEQRLHPSLALRRAFAVVLAAACHRRCRRSLPSLRLPAGARSPGLRLVHGAEPAPSNESERAPVHGLEQRAGPTVASCLARVPAAPSARLRGGQLRAVLASLSAELREGSRRSQPVPGDARGARSGRAPASPHRSCARLSSRSSGLDDTRWRRSRSGPMLPFSLTLESTGTGRFLP